MIKTTPFHERLERAQHDRAVGPLVGLPVGAEVRHVREARVLRRPQQRRVLRHLAAVQVPDHGQATPRRFLGGVMTRDIRPCRPGRAQYTIWCDDRGYVLEDGVVFRALRERVPADRGRAQPRLLQRPDRPARRHDRGRHRRLRHARRPGTALARRSSRKLAPEVEGLAFFEHTEAKIGSAAGHDLAHRLHRRPRLRDPGRAPTTRSPCSTP